MTTTRATVEQLAARIVEADNPSGSHFDYAAQRWVDGSTHYHVTDSGDVGYCGRDLAGCRKMERFLADASADRLADFLHVGGYVRSAEDARLAAGRVSAILASRVSA